MRPPETARRARRAARLLALVLALGPAATAALAAFPDSPPNDPLYDASPVPNSTAEQWDLTSDRGISVDRAWRLSTGAGAIVADVDVGVQLTHEELADRWLLNPGETGSDARGRDRRSNGIDDDRNGYVDDWRGWDFYDGDGDPTSDTENEHGTNVASVLGAATDNGKGIAGIAPGARILPLRTAENILHQSNRLAQAIVYAADRRADVVSMSLGAESGSRALRAAAAYAQRRGTVLVAAMGNEFHYHHEFPAVLDEVIAVGGINPDTATFAALGAPVPGAANDFTVHAAYSNTGPHIDVVAPTQVPTARWDNRYSTNWSGTSAATPHVAALATLIVARGRAQGLRLTPREVRQIIRQTADDLDDPARGYAPGWDMLSGWGRVNALRALERVAAGKLPPEADITAPAWYDPVRGLIDVKAVARGRSAVRWTLEAGAGEQPREWRTIATGGAATGAAPRRLARLDTSRLEPGGWTLRLRVTDARGNLGEDRAFFLVLRDPALGPRFPVRLSSSGESSPVLADIAGDGALEIVLATSDGALRVISGRSGRTLRPWPRHMRRAPGSRPSARRIGALRRGFLATPAVGDITGDGRPEIVAPGLDGRVYAWDARGRAVRGFPVAIDLRRTAEKGRLDAAIYASPALADLSGDGRLDIVVGAADQRVYAWDGRGRRLPGWPVLARDGEGGDRAKILSSPAIGDLDGDRSPDVVEGTGEAYGSTPDMSGRAYAWDRNGRLLPGWPVRPSGLAVESLPIVGEGVPTSPVLADVDGDGRDEVGLAAFTGQPELYRGDGTRLTGPGGAGHFATQGRGPASRASAAAVVALGANAAFGRTRPGGPLRLFGGVADTRLAAAQAAPGNDVPFEHLLGGWDAASGDWLPGMPAPIEGWQIATAPAIADVDGDGAGEAIAPSSGYLVHAFREDGSEPAGWPKQTGGWVLASPAVGDVDGDGLLEVVAVSREGRLFAWDTPTRASTPQEWPSFRRDTRNTGRWAP